MAANPPEDAGADNRPLIDPNPDGISTEARREKSLHGHSLRALKIGLQRSVRQGDVDEAGRIGWELTTFRNAPGIFDRVARHIHTLLMEIFLECVGDMGVAVDFIDAWKALDPAADHYPATISRMAMALAAHPKSESCLITERDNDLTLRPFYPAIAPVLERYDEDREYTRLNHEESFRDRLRAALMSESHLERMKSLMYARAITSWGKPRRIGRRTKTVYQVFQVLEETLPPYLAAAAEAIRSIIHLVSGTQGYGLGARWSWIPLLAAYLLDHAEYDEEMEDSRIGMRQLLEVDNGYPDGRPGANRPLRDYKNMREFPKVRTQYKNPIRLNNLAPYVDVIARRYKHDTRRIRYSFPPLGQGGEEHPIAQDTADEVIRGIRALRIPLVNLGWNGPGIREEFDRLCELGAAAVADAMAAEDSAEDSEDEDSEGE